MSVKLELHLEGSDVNEETSRDLLKWLKLADILDVRVQEQHTSPVAGQLGTGVDPWTIVIILLNVPQTVVAIKQIFDCVHNWQEKRKMERKPDTPVVIKSDDDDIQQRINAQLEKIRQKRDSKKAQ